jgi:hypothetical protein
VVGAPPALMFNMFLASAVLIGTVVVIVILSIALYKNEEKKRLD